MNLVPKKQQHFGYLVIGLSLLATYAIYFGSLWHYDGWYEYPLKYIAKIGSMGTTLLMCWAFILATRFRLIEHLFGGLDKVYKAHRRVGEIAFVLIFLHPLFLALDPEFSFGGYFWIARMPGEAGHYYLARMTGIVALLIFILLVALSIWITMRYHRWKQTHNFFGLLLILIVIHAVLANGEISAYPLLRAWFVAWVGLGLFCYFYKRLFYRWFGPLYDYVVDRVETLGDITEVYLRPGNPRRAMAHKPGQFLYIYFESHELSSEPHPFSISSAPQAEQLRISVKELGDWTGKLHTLEHGAHAFVWGPYGKFGQHITKHPDKEAVLLAGGIGITPFLSMVEDENLRSRKSPKVHLFYSVEKPAHNYYHSEIEKLDGNMERLHYLPHCSDEEGFLTADVISKRTGGNLGEKIFLICGPKPMMDSLREQLLEAGVPTDHIFTEDFSII